MSVLLKANCLCSKSVSQFRVYGLVPVGDKEVGVRGRKGPIYAKLNRNRSPFFI
jgi:hypothetical protein